MSELGERRFPRMSTEVDKDDNVKRVTISDLAGTDPDFLKRILAVHLPSITEGQVIKPTKSIIRFKSTNGDMHIANPGYMNKNLSTPDQQEEFLDIVLHGKTPITDSPLDSIIIETEPDIPSDLTYIVERGK